MSFIAFECRFVVSCVLALSMTASGVCAPLCGGKLRCGSGCGFASTVASHQDCCQECCCGKGGTCGMPCCQKSSSKQVPVSPPARVNIDENQSELIALELSAQLGDVVGACRFGAWADHSCGHVLSFPTLQMQHVRIQT